jgi:hypothetical protein
MIEAILRHVALPAVAPAAVIGLYFTPVLLFGCVNGGGGFCHGADRLARAGTRPLIGQVADLDRDPHHPAGPGPGPAGLMGGG